MTIWLISDRRLGGLSGDLGGVKIARKLPAGAVIYLRSRELTKANRRRLLRQLRRIARVRGLGLALSAPPPQAHRNGADIVHIRSSNPNHNTATLARQAAQARVARKIGLQIAIPVHNHREALRARAIGANYWLIAPVYPTASHPQTPAIGSKGLARMAKHRHSAQRAQPVQAKAWAGAGHPAPRTIESRKSKQTNKRARGQGGCMVALGGMTARRAAHLQLQFGGQSSGQMSNLPINRRIGWAAIGAWAQQ